LDGAVDVADAGAGGCLPDVAWSADAGVAGGLGSGGEGDGVTGNAGGEGVGAYLSDDGVAV
jgi:hypothetical protein